MLTEIEWWGGLLFIWLAFCYITMYEEYKDEPKFEVGFLSTNIAFFTSATVLSLYFYTLDTQLIQHIYLGAIALGILSTVLMFFWPGTESMKYKVAAKQKSSEDEKEIGKVFEILGAMIFFLPVIASFGLGAYKSREFLDGFPFLN